MVRIKTERYQFSHGKQPRGYGYWYFKIGDEIRRFVGRYTEAKAQAIKEAHQKGVVEIEVLP